MTFFYLDKILDILVNLVTAFFIFLIPWLWYHYFSKIPLKGYFVKTKLKVPSNRNYFKIGTKPNGTFRFPEFDSEGYFAIGWPDIGDLTEHVNDKESEIREIIHSKLEQDEPNKTRRGQIAGYFVKFLSIKKGDVIVTSVENNLYIYTVQNSYFYSTSNIPDHTAHRIKVDLNSKVIVPIRDASDISPKFKRAAQNRLTIISLNGYATQIEMLLAQ